MPVHQARRPVLHRPEEPDRDQGNHIPLPICKRKMQFTDEGPMLRLASILYTLISTTFAGIGVIAVLVAGYGTLTPILISAAAGAVLALPVSWVVARQLVGDPVTR